MTIETRTLSVGTDWTLISNANVAGFRAQVVSAGAAMLHVGLTAPESGSQNGMILRDYAFSNLTTEKIYARAIDGVAVIRCIRGVDAANPAILELRPILVTPVAGLSVGAATGTLVATVSQLVSGSSVDLLHSGGRLVFERTDGASGIVKIGAAANADATIVYTISQTLPGAWNSPLSTLASAVFTVPSQDQLPALPSGYAYISNSAGAIYTSPVTGALLYRKVA